MTLIVAIVYEPAGRRSTLKVVSFAPAPEAPRFYDRVRQTIIEWGHPVAGILSGFASAGFAGVERVWTTTDDPESEHRLVVVARR